MVNRFAGSVLVALDHPIITTSVILLLAGTLIFGFYKLVRMIIRLVFRAI
jgi:hypothetical protein